MLSGYGRERRRSRCLGSRCNATLLARRSCGRHHRRGRLRLSASVTRRSAFVCAPAWHPFCRYDAKLTINRPDAAAPRAQVPESPLGAKFRNRAACRSKLEVRRRYVLALRTLSSICQFQAGLLSLIGAMTSAQGRSRQIVARQRLLDVRCSPKATQVRALASVAKGHGGGRREPLQRPVMIVARFYAQSPGPCCGTSRQHRSDGCERWCERLSHAQ